jgi:hypothetical protein
MSAPQVVVGLLRFLSEVAALVGLALWGFGAMWYLGILVPVAGAAIWGRWMAPRSAHRLGDPQRLAAEVVFFAIAAAALAVAVSPAVGIAYGVAAISCAALVRYAGEPGPTPAA